ADARPGVPPPQPPAPAAGEWPALAARPAVGPQELRVLRRGEFVLVVNGPARRLVPLAQALPARLPVPAPGTAGQPRWLVRRTAVSYGEVP
ncbi:MAG: hypothetical protein JO242_20100, partial [Streptosporangiaceae bacterium]|nr:hypothetical protein [Streptosporangiaceae bacterium]